MRVGFGFGSEAVARARVRVSGQVGSVARARVGAVVRARVGRASKCARLLVWVVYATPCSARKRRPTWLGLGVGVGIGLG